MMAALASAAMPNATIAGTRDSEQVNATDKGYGIDHAVVQDAAGKLYDTFASNTPKGRKRLVGRVRAAQTLMGNRELVRRRSRSGVLQRRTGEVRHRRRFRDDRHAS